MNKLVQIVWFGMIFVGAQIVLSCVDVASGRASRDIEIGKASANGIRVTVERGLAAVRHIDNAELHLWASAPSLSFQIDPTEATPGPFRVRIENVVDNAVLTVTSSDTAPISVNIVSSPFPTEKTWQFAMEPGKSVTVKLAAPDEFLNEPWRFAVYADVQDAIDNVHEIYAKMNETPNIRFAVISGDLTSQGTAAQLEEFQAAMKVLKFPCFATLGNHELGTRDDLYHDYFGRGNYSFRFRDVQFSMLDSASATIDPLVYTWLDGWLDESRDKLHVVTMHIAPIDPVGARNGSFASRAEADKLLTKLANGGVDLTLYGHVHSFYAFENAAIPAYISGGGGAIPERLDGIGRHFLTVDVSPPNRIEQVAVVRVD